MAAARASTTLLWFVPLLYCRSLGFRQFCVQLIDMLGLGDHLFTDQVDEIKQGLGGLPIIPKVDLTWMDSFISDHAHRVECSLHTHIKALLHERRNIII